MKNPVYDIEGSKSAEQDSNYPIIDFKKIICELLDRDIFSKSIEKGIVTS